MNAILRYIKSDPLIVLLLALPLTLVAQSQHWAPAAILALRPWDHPWRRGSAGLLSRRTTRGRRRAQLLNPPGNAAGDHHHLGHPPDC
jgi:hypothetical protein